MMEIYNTPLEFRRQALLPYINLGGLGLEVGAFMHPTISHLEGKVEFLDFYSTNELQAQAQQLGQDPNRVVAVNYVARNDRYSEYVQNSFDYVIANHVFEHVSNPIAWLQMLNQMLNDNGVIFLTIPDKKYNFDRYRLDTQLSHILYDYFTDRTEIDPEHSLESALYYDRTYAKLDMQIEQQFEESRLRRDTYRPHPGVHSHVFQAELFLAKILNPVLYMRLLDCHLKYFAISSQYGEFAVVLGKGWQPVSMELEDFYGPAADTVVK